MICPMCKEFIATKHYKSMYICGECLKQFCLFCSAKSAEPVLALACPGHTVTFNNKANRFLEDKQFLNEATFVQESGDN
jgi:hypothetical protein